MALVDEDRADHIYEAMGPAIEISGGWLPTRSWDCEPRGRSAFAGKVRDDALGQVFAHDIRAAGVNFDTLRCVRRRLDRALLCVGDA